MAENKQGGYWWADTYGNGQEPTKGSASGSNKGANTNTAQSVNEEEINKAYNADVKNRQTDTFKNK